MRWYRIQDKEPPAWVNLLAVVTYLEAPFEEGGYVDEKAFWTPPQIRITSIHKHLNGYPDSRCGGKITHWMPLPEIPYD